MKRPQKASEVWFRPAMELKDFRQSAIERRSTEVVIRWDLFDFSGNYNYHYKLY